MEQELEILLAGQGSLGLLLEFRTAGSHYPQRSLVAQEGSATIAEFGTDSIAAVVAAQDIHIGTQGIPIGKPDSPRETLSSIVFGTGRQLPELGHC